MEGKERGNILVVDDSKIIHKKVREFLVQREYQVEMVESGEEALEIIKKIRFDIILLDIEMSPGIDGFEVFRILRDKKETKLLPVVIFFSKYIQRKIEGFQLGASDFIDKELFFKDAVEFLARIETHVRIARQTRDAIKLERLETQKEITKEIFCELSDPLSDISATIGEMQKYGGDNAKLYGEQIKEEMKKVNIILRKLPWTKNVNVKKMVEGSRVKIILVVDDDVITRALLARQVKKLQEGYQVFTAKNGRRGLEVLYQYPVDLVLTDCEMPEMDGLAMFAEINKMPAPPPVVMISGNDDKELPHTFLQNGGAGFIKKPFELNELKLKIEQIFAKERGLHENDPGSGQRSEHAPCVSAAI